MRLEVTGERYFKLFVTGTGAYVSQHLSIEEAIERANEYALENGPSALTLVPPPKLIEFREVEE